MLNFSDANRDMALQMSAIAAVNIQTLLRFLDEYYPGPVITLKPPVSRNSIKFVIADGGSSSDLQAACQLNDIEIKDDTLVA